MSWGRDIGEDGLCDPLGMVSERNGRAQQVFCYRAGDKPVGGRGVGFDSLQPQGRYGSVFSLLVALGGAVLGLVEGGCCWHWCLGQSNK